MSFNFDNFAKYLQSEKNMSDNLLEPNMKLDRNTLNLLCKIVLEMKHNKLQIKEVKKFLKDNGYFICNISAHILYVKNLFQDNDLKYIGNNKSDNFTQYLETRVNIKKFKKTDEIYNTLFSTNLPYNLFLLYKILSNNNTRIKGIFKTDLNETKKKEVIMANNMLYLYVLYSLIKNNDIEFQLPIGKDSAKYRLEILLELYEMMKALLLNNLHLDIFKGYNHIFIPMLVESLKSIRYSIKSNINTENIDGRITNKYSKELYLREKLFDFK